jgi:hypothetical protein
MKRENLSRANTISGLVVEKEAQISRLDELVEKICQVEQDFFESPPSIEIRVVRTHCIDTTIHHIFTTGDLQHMINLRKDILIEERRVLLNELETL